MDLPKAIEFARPIRLPPAHLPATTLVLLTHSLCQLTAHLELYMKAVHLHKHSAVVAKMYVWLIPSILPSSSHVLPLLGNTIVVQQSQLHAKAHLRVGRRQLPSRQIGHTCSGNPPLIPVPEELSQQPSGQPHRHELEQTRPCHCW